MIRSSLTSSLSITTINPSYYQLLAKMQNLKILSEYDMVSHLANTLQNEFETDAYAREFTVGYGIADLVFAKSFYSSQNKLQRKPISNYYALVLYLSLQPGKEVTASEAQTMLRSSASVARAALSALLEDGYISSTSKGRYSKTRTIEQPQLKLVAIEAKLRDWRSGILQARRYKAFTDESYLAILSKFERNIDPQLLEQHDIGLILVDEEFGSIVFKRRPVGRRPQSMIENLETELYANELFLTKFSIRTA